MFYFGKDTIFIVRISIVDKMNHDLRKPILDRSTLPKLSSHLGINEIYQDPRQNFSLSISHNAIPRLLINTRYTPIFADYGFHDGFAKHLSKAWFHMDQYRQPTPFLQLLTIHTTNKYAGIPLDHIMVYISHHIELTPIVTFNS